MAMAMAMAMEVISSKKQPLHRMMKASSYVLMSGMTALFSAQLVAGDWKISPHILMKGTYTDNANLSSSDKNGQFYTQVTPGVAIKREGAGRMQLNADYSLSYTGNRPGSRGRTIAHSLTSKMQAELYKNIIFIDANAGARLGSVTTGGQRSGAIVGDTSNPIQTYTYNLSPYFKHHFGRYADILTRYTFNQVINSGKSGLDSYSNQVLISINSGSYYPRFPWGISYQQSKTGYDNAIRDSEKTSFNSNISYILNRKWRINFNGGKVDYNIQSSRSSTDRVTWSAGVAWTPNLRTNMDFSYGQKMFGSSFEFNFSHRLRRSIWTLNYNKSLTSSRSQQLAQSSNVSGLSGNQSANNYQPGYSYSDYATLTDEFYVIETLNTGFTLKTRRSNLSIDAHFTRRGYEVSGNNGRDIGINTSWGRQLTPKTDAKVVVSWQKNRVNENVAEQTRWRLSLGLSRRLTEYTSANLGYMHSRLNSTGSTGEYEENQISLSLASKW